MRHILTVFLLAAWAASSGCRFPPDYDLPRYATNEEIIGTWVLAGDTQKPDKKGGLRVPRPKEGWLTLDADGTYFATGHMEGELGHASAGTWKLLHDTPAPAGKKRKNEIMLSDGTRSGSLYLTADDKNRLRLWLFVGDPDDWETAWYDKKS